MIKEYVCRFEKEKRCTELVFEIEQNPVSEVWSDLVVTHIEKGNKYPLNVNNKLNLDYTKIVKEIIDISSTLGLPVDFDENSYSQYQLNRLHEQFHFKEERVRGTKEFVNNINLYHDLNIKIHQLESERKKPYSVSWFINDDKGPFIPIDDDHWKCFSAWWYKSYKPHSLFLGYHTIGKDILTCYADNDYELIQKDGVRQPELFSTETIYSSTKRTRKNKTSEIKRWLKLHNCKNKIDWTLPKFKYYQGHAYLGKLRNNRTNDQILDIWTTWNFKEVDIN